jgi:hypothetical protein
MPEPASPGLQPYASKWRSSSAGEEFANGIHYCGNPYQRRAQHAGQCGVEVEGGQVSTRDWWLNLQILTSGGFRSAVASSTT